MRQRLVTAPQKLKREDTAAIEAAAARAQEQTTLARTVVKPMEQEISALKRKIEALMQGHSSTASASTPSIPSSVTNPAAHDEIAELRLERVWAAPLPRTVMCGAVEAARPGDGDAGGPHANGRPAGRGAAAAVCADTAVFVEAATRCLAGLR